MATDPSQSEDAGASVQDTVWQVLVSDLVVRTEPSVADPATILRAGLTEEDRVLVVDGPVAADGYEWYQVLPLRPDGLRERPFGWVAAASRAGEPWMVMEDLECPGTPVLAALVRMAPEERLACFDGRTIRFIADETGACGAGGGFPVTWEPRWLADPSGCGFGARPGEIRLLLRFPPGAPQDFAPGDEVIGHFDDPAAQTCHAIANSPDVEPPSPTEAVALCRTEFVVEAVTNR